MAFPRTELGRCSLTSVNESRYTSYQTIAAKLQIVSRFISVDKENGGYLLEKLGERLVIRDHHGAIIILEASMNYTAASALPQSAYPQFVVLALPVLVLLGALRFKKFHQPHRRPNYP